MNSKIQEIIEQINSLTDGETNELQEVLLKKWGFRIFRSSGRSANSKALARPQRMTGTIKVRNNPYNTRNLTIAINRKTLKPKNSAQHPKDQLPGNPTTKAPAPKPKKSTKNK